MDDEKKLTKEQMEIVVGGVEEDQSMEETYEPTPAYVITDDCISCGACASACPCSAISEADGKYAINYALCVECGACADTCPIGAISG